MGLIEQAVSRAKDIVAAVEWEGDMRVNMTTVIGAGRVLAKRVGELEAALTQHAETGRVLCDCGHPLERATWCSNCTPVQFPPPAGAVLNELREKNAQHAERVAALEGLVAEWKRLSNGVGLSMREEAAYDTCADELAAVLRGGEAGNES